MKDDRWTIRSTQLQIKGVRSVGIPKRWRDDIVGQQGVVWTRIAKDRERWRTLVAGYFPQWKDTAYNRTEYNKEQINLGLPGIVKHAGITFWHNLANTLTFI